MTAADDTVPLIDEDFDVLSELVPPAGLDIIELGYGSAKLARTLLEHHPGSRVTDLEVDERQHAKNIAPPPQGQTFAIGGAQAIPFPAASFDLVPLLAQALGEAARVCRCSSRISPTSSSA